MKPLGLAFNANAGIAVFLHVVLSGFLLFFLLRASEPTNAMLAVLIKAGAAALYLGATVAGAWLWRRGSVGILLLAPVSVGLQVLMIWMGNELVSWVIPYGATP